MYAHNEIIIVFNSKRYQTVCVTFTDCILVTYKITDCIPVAYSFTDCIPVTYSFTDCNSVTSSTSGDFVTGKLLLITGKTIKS